MKATVSVIKADIGSIGGHIKPSEEVLETVKGHIGKALGTVISDLRVFYTGDDIAILMAHNRGSGDEKVHKLAWDAFVEGTKKAKEQGLYGAGQDLLKDAFSGNVKGMGPAVAELEFEEREKEPFVLFMADKTDPGAFSLPLYLAFTDPFYNAGLLISPKMKDGFVFKIMDVSYTKADKVISLKAPEELYDIAALLRDVEKYVVEGIYTVKGEQVVSVSTTRLHNIAGKYVGKDDPVCLVRCQGDFPATGEILAPYSVAPYVAGFMRGSHNGPLMPCKLNTSISYFDGPPIVTGAAMCVQDGKLTGPADVFDHPSWEVIREKAMKKALSIREQGFFGCAMLPMSELEYGGIVERLDRLEKKFRIKEKK